MQFHHPRVFTQGVESLVPEFGPRRFINGLVSPPAIFLRSGTAFARNSDSLVSPPAVYRIAGGEMWHKTSQKRRGPTYGTRHPSQNHRGRYIAQDPSADVAKLDEIIEFIP